MYGTNHFESNKSIGPTLNVAANTISNDHVTFNMIENFSATASNNKVHFYTGDGTFNV